VGQQIDVEVRRDRQEDRDGTWWIGVDPLVGRGRHDVLPVLAATVGRAGSSVVSDAIVPSRECRYRFKRLPDLENAG
jgi:hypothetical protein